MQLAMLGILAPHNHAPVPSPRRGWARRREGRWVGDPCAVRGASAQLCCLCPHSLCTKGGGRVEKHPPKAFHSSLSFCVFVFLCVVQAVRARCCARGRVVEPADAERRTRRRAHADDEHTGATTKRPKSCHVTGFAVIGLILSHGIVVIGL